MLTSVYSYNSVDWKNFFSQKGLSGHLLNFWLDGLYKDRSIWDRHISSAHLEEFKKIFTFDLPKIKKVLASDDGTIKFQIAFADDMEVETVLIPFHKRYTVCLSTQVGCAMNCQFCFTGTQGLKRHLKAEEIVGQYLRAYEYLLTQKHDSLKPNVVFMGQGEPLHNVDEVGKAISVLTDEKIIGLGQRQLTLSTVGYLPAMDKLLNFPQINFALSLHSPFHDQRSQLIPVNERYPISEVLLKLDQIPLLKRQFITYEYLLIKNFNMTDAHVDELSQLLGHRKAILNLIPFNPFPGSDWQRPTLTEIDDFKAKLVAKKLRVMVRTTKGDDILAACGQLKINKMARNYVNS